MRWSRLVFSGCFAYETLLYYLPVGFPVGIDVFAYTRAEFERLRETSPGWYKAIASGTQL